MDGDIFGVVFLRLGNILCSIFDFSDGGRFGSSWCFVRRNFRVLGDYWFREVVVG